MDPMPGPNTLAPPGANGDSPGAAIPDDTTLRPLCSVWIEKVRLAQEHRDKKIGKVARACWKFVNGPHDHVYRKSGSQDAVPGMDWSPPPDAEAPTFRVTYNVAFELLTIFGPMLYHRNPTRTVEPRQVWEPPAELVTNQDPYTPLDQAMIQGRLEYERRKVQERTLARAKADLMASLLNYTPNEFGLARHMRLAIDQALIGGQGTLWVEAQTIPVSGRTVIVSTFDDADNLLWDPDAKRLADAKWIARRCVHPAWEVERQYGLPPGSLKSRVGRSTTAAAAERAGEAPGPGQTADQCVYWKVWSKMGMGARLKKSAAGLSLGDASDVTEQFGDEVYFVVAPDVPFPLNCPWPLLQQAVATKDSGLMRQCGGYFQWPVPFYCDPTTGWPVADLDFHPDPKSAFATPHLGPALGEMAALDWMFSFQMGHVQQSCRTLIAVSNAADENFKQQLESGKDFVVIEVNTSLGKTASELVSFIQHPPMNPDVPAVTQTIRQNFDRRTGLSEILYGSTSTQSRSAQDAAAKQSGLQIRPDDMANSVEDFAAKVARMEALASRLVLTGRDVAAVLGPFAGQFWDQYLAVARDPMTGIPVGDSLASACAEYEYRIESGSARKPNKDRDVANTDTAVQHLLPSLQQLAQAYGIWGPYNALLRDWARARDLNPDDYLVDVGFVQQVQQMLAQQQAPPGGPVSSETGPPLQGQPQQGPPQEASAQPSVGQPTG